ncbi:effector binding domain-containing protein [Oceanobacillus manasiensis]|uniref:effector binding domain-containing protein n=1 Tax=Oceanobacillus manasiensis TaxID=586413 RepID=UPI0005A95001|nr:effector binding domain-containing protein [Oceanobacillus manasiensis]
MELKILNRVRTNNFNDKQVLQKITDLWKGASTDLSKHQGNTYGLYHEYESNYKGDYSLGIAIEGKSETTVVIPDEAKYEVFHVNTDEEQGIFNKWNEIWKKEENGQLKRAYTYDFEKYYQDGKIEIYIAIEED